MEFALIHENKLKVILTAGELEELSLTYEQMDYQDPETRRALVVILDRSRAHVRFNPQRSKLFIEVYPCEGGGCVLYFTCLPQSAVTGPGPGMEPVLFEFENAADLIQGASRASQRYGHRIYRSALYRLEDKYRLIVYPLDYSDRLSVYFLSEYGRRIGEGELLAAFTTEHGEEIFQDDAIEILAEYFGN